jgi:hypothetical protein
VAVDEGVVVVPAEGGEVVGVVVPALVAGGDVVGLEPVGGGAAFDHTSCVAGEDEAAESGWDGGGSGADRKRLAVLGEGGDFDHCFAEELFEGGGSDPGSGDDPPAGFAVGGGGGFGFDHHRDRDR